MKKRKIIYSILYLCIFFFSKKTIEAKTFTEEINYVYQYKVVWQPYNATVYKDFSKMIDEEGFAYYDVTPSNSIWMKENFIAKDFSASLDVFKKIAQYIYYGYGYQGNYEDIEYFATQMLIYRLFPKYHISVITNYADSSYLEEKIKEIENRILSSSFPLNNFHTKDDFYVIKNSYLVKNFHVIGENISVFYKDDEIHIEFLNNQEKYNLQFQPKSCEAKYFESDRGHGLIRMDHLCEKSHSVLVTHEKKEEELNENLPLKEEIENSVSNLENIDVSSKGEIIQEQEKFLVNVPNTSKSSFKGLSFLFMFLFLLKQKKH